MVKYGLKNMARILVNKHYSDSALITIDKFLNDGELIISNEYGFEGIFIKNNNGDVIKIGPGGSSGSGGTPSSGSSGDYVDREWVKAYLKSGAYTTSAMTDHMIDEAVSGIEESVRFAYDEITRVTASADPRYDTFKKISDWINERDEDPYLNEKISEISAATEHVYGSVSELSAATEQVSGNLSALSGVTEALKEFVETNSGASEAIAALKAYIDEQISAVARSGDHVFLSRSEYDQLVRDGVAIVSGETIYYHDTFYYCIYEGDEQPIPQDRTYADIDENSGIMSLSGMVELSEDGETLIINGVQYIDEDGGIIVFSDDGVQPEPEHVQPSIDDETGEGVLPSESTDEEIEDTGILTLSSGVLDGDTLIIG